MITPPIPNPFPFTSPASGQDFYGRKEALRRIFEATSSGRSVAVCGARYMGKSSLLAHVQTHETQAAYGLDPDLWIFARIGCSRISTSAELADKAVNTIRRQMGLRRHTLSMSAQEVLTKPEQREHYGLSTSADLNALTQVGRALRARNGGLVLLLDDFERLLTLPEAHIVTELLGLAAGGVPLLLTFDRPLTELLNHPDFGEPGATQRFYTYHKSSLDTLAAAIGSALELGPLSDEEATEILRSGFRDSGVVLSESDEALILKLGGGHPVLLQTGAFLSFDLLTARGHAGLPDNFETLVGDAGQSYLTSLWHSMAPPTQRYTYLVAQKGAQEAARIAQSQEAVEALRKHHVLVGDGAGRLFSPLFLRFVKERMPIPAPEGPTLTGEFRLRSEEKTATRTSWRHGRWTNAGVVPAGVDREDEAEEEGRSTAPWMALGLPEETQTTTGAQDTRIFTSLGGKLSSADAHALTRLEQLRERFRPQHPPSVSAPMPPDAGAPKAKGAKRDREQSPRTGSWSALKGSALNATSDELDTAQQAQTAPSADSAAFSSELQAPPLASTLDRRSPFAQLPAQASPTPGRPRSPMAPSRTWALRLTFIAALAMALSLIGSMWMGASISPSSTTKRSTSPLGEPRPSPLEQPPPVTGVAFFLLLAAPFLGYSLGVVLDYTRPSPQLPALPETEASALESLRRALIDGTTDKGWASALVEMASATTLDAIADSRWAVASMELHDSDDEGLFERARPQTQVLRALTDITQACSAAVRAVSSSNRSIHLARALAHLEGLDAPTRALGSGPVRDGIWLVGRVWRRVLVDAVEGSVGHPRLEATLLTPQVRFGEEVEIALEVANRGDSSAMAVEVTLLPMVGAAIRSDERLAVGELAPNLAVRVRFALSPYRREPIYLTFHVEHHDPMRGSQVLQLNERLAFVDLQGRFTRVQPIPYITGKPLEPGQIFVGRQQDLAFVEEAILESATPPTILVIGRRRMGKTSLLRHIPKQLGERAVCVPIDFQARPTDDLHDLMLWIATQLRAQVGGSHLPPVGREDFEADPGAALTHLGLDPLITAAGPRPVVLLIDEVEALYQPIEEGRLSHRFFENIRSLIQQRPQVALVLAGTPRLAQRSSSSQSVLFGASLTRELSFLDRADVAELMRAPLRQFNIEVAPLAIDRLHHLAGGHPLLSQHLCYHLVRRLNQLEIAFVTAEDVDAVIPAAAEGAQEHLRLWWNEAGPRERWLLVALSKTGSRPQRPADLQIQLERFGIRAPLAEVRLRLSGLYAREVLQEHGETSSTTFRQELLRLWVEQNFGAQEARALLVPWDGPPAGTPT